MDANVEFERQLANLIAKGYPSMFEVGEREFRERLEPLRHRIMHAMQQDLIEDGSAETIPFLIVMHGDRFDRVMAMQQVERNGKSGFSVMDSEDVRTFQPVDGVELPDGPAYAVIGADIAPDTFNVAPNDAWNIIAERNRSPLTIDEGIALATHFPQIVRKNNGFSLLASRCGDRRVTALWISEGRPKLGWCWAGNPHTWLGSASCRSRR